MAQSPGSAFIVTTSHHISRFNNNHLLSTADAIMAAHNEYITEETFEGFFEAHSKSLRGEFHRIHDKVDQGFQRLYQKFDAIDESFQRIDQRLETIDEKFQRIDERFDAVDYKMSQNEARARNYRLARLHHKVQMITVLDTTSFIKATIKKPAIFPATIRDFWNLRKKPASMSYLFRFYNLSGWKNWGSHSSDLESSDSESENSTSAKSTLSEPSSRKSSPPSLFPLQPRTLEEAIDAHPELALQDIAEEIGLDYDRIESIVREYKIHHTKQALTQAPLKRSTPPKLIRDLSSKRQRPEPPLSPPIPILRFTVDDLEASQERIDNLPRSESSVHTELDWLVGNQPPTVKSSGSPSVAGST